MLKDCYIRFSEDKRLFTIGNTSIEKKVEICGALLRTVGITDKKNGVVWTGEARTWQRSPVLQADEQPECTLTCSIIDEKPWIASCLKAELTLKGKNGTAWYEYKIFPGIPFIFQQSFLLKNSNIIHAEKTDEACVSDGVEKGQEERGSTDVFCSSDTLECIPLTRRQYMLESFLLTDKTDMNDCLVERSEIPVYYRFSTGREGNIFCVKDYPNGNALLLVKHSPVPSSALNRPSKDLLITDSRYVILQGTGVDVNDLPAERIPCYASAIGAAKTENIWEEFWRYSCALSKGGISPNLFIMSNTWGDRSADMAICERFILSELDRARELGIDIVQIDDGWECGVTSNAHRKKGGVWENYYGYASNFWEVNPERFPNGLEPIIEKANEYGVKIGLWFGPDSSNDFFNIDKDIETLWGLHQRYGVEYFKLDGVKIKSKLGEARFIRMLNELTERSQGRISFNLDVTAEDRFGYLYEVQFGTIFVENRYTDWGNYFPHNTFRNLWSLAHVILPRRLQMEVLNPRRNADKYKGMSFAPDRYGMDYLFATVMPANPLIWMEMSYLGKEDGDVLSRIIHIYRTHRKELFDSRIIPIGQCPNGMSFSGYLSFAADKTEGYLLLFREETVENEYTFKLPFANANTKLIYQSGSADYIFTPAGLHVTFQDQKSFVWLRFENVCTTQNAKVHRIKNERISSDE